MFIRSKKLIYFYGFARLHALLLWLEGVCLYIDHNLAVSYAIELDGNYCPETESYIQTFIDEGQHCVVELTTS